MAKLKEKTERAAAPDDAQRLPATPSDDAGKQASFADIMAQAKQIQWQKQKGPDSNRDAALVVYRNFLAGKPGEVAADTVVEIAEVLGKTFNQVEADRNAVIAAVHAARMFESMEEFRENRKRIIYLVRELEYRQTQELLDAKCAEARASSLLDQTISARDNLHRLANTHPDLFDVSTQPPRLVVPPAEEAPAPDDSLVKRALAEIGERVKPEHWFSVPDRPAHCRAIAPEHMRPEPPQLAPSQAAVPGDDDAAPEWDGMEADE